MKQLILACMVLCLCLLALPACDDSSEEGFGLFLADSGELVLSDEHIEAYNSQTHEIELNREGIEKWNAYMTYSAIPKLHQTLFGKEFVVKVAGDNIYSGKFWSMLSSSTCDGVVILESLAELDDEHNTIRIQLGYPWAQNADAEDPRDDLRIIDFFEKKGLLK